MAGKGKSIGTWILVVLLALVFMGSGVGKLLGKSPMPENFTRWGYPLWFMSLTGLIELLGGVALLFPRLTTAGSAVLGATMIGAIVTHIKSGEGPMAAAPLILLVLLGIAGYLRRGEMKRMFGGPPPAKVSP